MPDEIVDNKPDSKEVLKFQLHVVTTALDRWDQQMAQMRAELRRLKKDLELQLNRN